MDGNSSKSTQDQVDKTAQVVAVCISAGGVPKLPVASAEVNIEGLVGDGHDHKKHYRPDRAVSIQDLEVLKELQAEGYPVAPGVTGENLTVSGLNVGQLSPGDQLCFADGPVLELSEPRKPCYVLDKIHPEVQQAVVGRCGYMASVVEPGRLFTGQHLWVRTAKD